MEVNEIVAKNLKAVREKQKLSLDNAAKLTGVSKSMLGQIERGEVNPTITVLWKIANGLKVSFTSLLDKSDKDIEIIHVKDVTPLIEDEGKFINYPIFRFDESHRFEVYNIEIHENGCLESEPHLHGTEEYITVFEGALKLIINEHKFEIKCGDSIRFRSDVKHTYLNSGSGITKLNMIIYYNK